MEKYCKRKKSEDYMSIWKKRIAAEKGISEICAERIVLKCMGLVKRMLYGNVMIAFQKQDGTFCLEKGTLVGYEKFFHREFKLTVKQESVVYWSEEQQGWRRFRISNLMDWKAIV